MAEKELAEKRIIPFSPPDISEAEIAEVAEALRSGWITTGPRTKELERRLADYCHTARMVCLNSATAAEELNLRVLGVGPGDEVIVPAYTYTATASAVIHCGAKVVFVDSQKNGDPVTHVPEMDYDAMEAAITERTKAIIPVDLGGIMCDYERIYQAVERKKGLFRPVGDVQSAIGRVAVVSDCAHALGASRRGKMAGEVSDFTSYSFHAVKNFTTAEGGAATWRIPGTDNDALYHQYQLYSLHGQSKDALAKTKLGAWEYDIVGPWYKCNMTDIMAAIGLRQLDRYPGLLERRKEIISQYDTLCDELNVFHLKHFGKDYSSSGHLYLTRIPGITAEQRNEIIEKLAERGVATNVHYKPLPMMTAYKAYGWRIKDFSNAYDYYHNLITLPLHTCLTDEMVTYTIDQFRTVVKEYILMMLRKWEDLPLEMQTDEVRVYYDILNKKRVSLFFKRGFDIAVSLILLVVLSPVFLVLAVAIKADSVGPVFYRQIRITQYNQSFRIHKFRSMVQDADKGSQVTVSGDARVTKIGRIIRKYRLDEISQVIDVLQGNMTFVGTRPEVPKYTASYTAEMMATLLLPAGVTSLASIYYKNEADLLDSAEDADKTYIDEVLPAKMYYNLKAIEVFSFWGDVRTMFMTVFAVLGKEYKVDGEVPVKKADREYIQQ